MKYFVVGFSILFCLGIAPASAKDPAFQFSREIKIPSHEEEELQSLLLDDHIYEMTLENYPDVRLVDGKRKAVSFILRKVRASRERNVRKQWTAKNYTAKPLEDGGLEITVELDEKDPRPQGLTLVSPLKNFEQRVRVYHSSNQSNWEPLAEESVIFDYSRYMDVRNMNISFPESTNRRFQIVIDNVTLEQESELLSLTRQFTDHKETNRSERTTVDRRPFRIERVEFWCEDKQKQSSGDEKVDYPVSKFQVEQNPEDRQTIIHVDTKRQPLTSFKLVTSDKNFSRHAVVEIEQDNGVNRTWKRIGQGTLSRIDFKNLKRENLSITFPETREAKYRIVIENRDNAPLEISGIQAEGNLYELVFLSTPETQYQMTYGDPEIKAASYDTATIQELLKKDFQPSQSELGKPQQIEIVEKIQWKGFLNNALYLIIGIVMLCVILGWTLFQAMKQVDNLPGEEDLPQTEEKEKS